MRKQLKTLTLIMSILLIVALTAGCSNTPSASPQSSGTAAPPASSAAAPSAAAPAAPAEPANADPYAPDPDTTYEIYAISSSGGPTNEDAVMKRHWEEQFNVKLDIVYIDGNFDEVMNLKFAGNEIPDVMASRSLSNLQKYVEQMLITPIPEDLLYAYMPGYLAQMEIESPGALKSGYVNGTLYGIPAEVRSHNQFRTPVVWRGDWLEKFGYEPGAYPETLEQWKDILYKFAKEDPDGNGSNDTYGMSDKAMNGIFGAFGVVRDPAPNAGDHWIDDGAGNLVCTTIQPEMKDALAFLAELYADGVIDPEFLTGENKGGYWALSHAFIEGKIGLTSMGAYYHWSSPEVFPAAQNYIEIKLATPGVEEKLVFGQPPVGPNGNIGITKAAELSQSFMVFGVQLADDLPKMAKIMEIQDYFCKDTDTYLSAYYGELGTFWEWNEQGVPTAIGEYTDPKVMARDGAHYSIVMLSHKRDHDVIGKTAVEWARGIGFDKNGIESKLLVTTPAFTKNGAELRKLRDETIQEIIMGKKTVDDFDAFVTQWLAMGGQDWVDEANEWYHEYNK